MPITKQVKEYEGGKVEIGPSSIYQNPTGKPGFAVWIESGTWYTALEIDSKKFGPHDYMVPGAFEGGLRDCKCGAWMLSSASGGPVDPFGPCPLNPKTERSQTETEIYSLQCACGRVQNVEVPHFTKLYAAMNKAGWGLIPTQHNFIVKGVCPKCREGESEQVPLQSS